MHSPRKSSPLASILRVSAGNFLEMYDFMVFAYYATYISNAFFPAASHFASLMYTLATFGAGFLMRPLGAILLGAYIDHHGRRAGLLLTLSLMSLGTLSLTLMPTYASIGLLAPIGIVAGRLLQGFSAGAELGGVSVYLAEIATPGHKGFFVSWQSASQQVAVIFAALLGLLLSANLSKEQMQSFGWRIPLAVGCLIIPLLFLLRRSLTETEDFLSRKEHPTLQQILRTLAANAKIVLLGTMLVTMTTVSFYLITAYTPTFGKDALHLADRTTLLVTLCVGASNFLWLPLMGALSDKLGRRPLLLATTSLAILTAYPAIAWLTSNPSFSRLLSVELWLSFLYASYNAAMVVHLTEIMPPSVRTAGFSLAYSLATALFGGFTPAICTYLIHQTHNPAMPATWLTFAALCGLTATFTTPAATQPKARE